MSSDDHYLKPTPVLTVVTDAVILPEELPFPPPSLHLWNNGCSHQEAQTGPLKGCRTARLKRKRTKGRGCDRTQRPREYGLAPEWVLELKYTKGQEWWAESGTMAVEGDRVCSGTNLPASPVKRYVGPRMESHGNQLLAQMQIRRICPVLVQM